MSGHGDAGAVRLKTAEPAEPVADMDTGTKNKHLTKRQMLAKIRKERIRGRRVPIDIKPEGKEFTGAARQKAVRRTRYLQI